MMIILSCNEFPEVNLFKYMKITKKYLATMVVALLPYLLSAQTVKDYFGQTPDLKVSGKEFVDPNGRPVTLHGVMDTPNSYFNGGRWGWADYQNPSGWIQPCRNYFTKVFDAITNTENGTYCNLFRLHLDPAWLRDNSITASGFTELSAQDKTATDPHGLEVKDEANIIHFSSQRLRTMLESLYIPILKDALAHGLYVVVRPPGVFPHDVTIGDYYYDYLLTVWDIISSNNDIKANSGKIFLELGNEPVRIWQKGKTNFAATDKARGDAYTAEGLAVNSSVLADYFQPIVNKIRANGFRGILLLPGLNFQADYRSYSKKAISDDNFGYAVHNYPGWYGGWDANQTEAQFISTFEAQVPVDQKPVIITEVDWSPEYSEGKSHVNEYGVETRANYGTWATGTTSGTTSGVLFQTTQNVGWGSRYKSLIDKHTNISWTLQGTSTYVNMDKYIANGTVEPAFLDLMKADGYPDARQACSGSCFDWFREYACGGRLPRNKMQAGDFFVHSTKEVTDAVSLLNGKTFVVTDAEGEKIFSIGQKENRWDVMPMDISSLENTTEQYPYVKFEKVAAKGDDVFTLRLYNGDDVAFRVWTDAQGYLNFQTGTQTTIFALGLGENSQYGQDGNNLGLWKVSYESGKGYVLENLGRQGEYLSPASGAPLAEKTYVRLFTDFGKVEFEPEVVDASTETTFGADKLDGKSFVLTDKNGEYIFGNNNQDLFSQKIEDVANMNLFYPCVKFTRVTDAQGCGVEGNLYTIQMQNTNGDFLSVYGLQGYLNFQPSGNTVFAMDKTNTFDGKSNKYGQDCDYGALWKVDYVEGKGFMIMNVARRMYLTPSDAKPQADETYVRLFENFGVSTENATATGKGTDIKEIPYQTWTAPKDGVKQSDFNGAYSNIGTDASGGRLIVGDGNVGYLNYADLSAYSRMVIKGTGQARILMNRLVNEGKAEDGNLIDFTVDISPEGKEIDLTKYQFVHLNAIKAPWGNAVTRITSITLYKDGDIADYNLHGSGVEQQSFLDALADADATVIDATGMTNTVNRGLRSANPNCLFIQGAGNLLDGTQNLVTKNGNIYTAGNISLYDGFAFFSPMEIASMASSYSRDLGSTQWAAVTLPFATTMPEGVNAYVLSKVSDGSMTLKKIAEGTVIAANQPFIYYKENAGETVFNGTGIAATISGYQQYPITGLDGWFICQSMERKIIEDVTTDAFFGQYDVYGISGDKFKHATKKLTTNPFRAFFLHKKSAGGAAPASFAIVVEDDEEATNGIHNSAFSIQNSAFYNLNGQKVSENYRGIVIKNGRKVVVKN